MILSEKIINALVDSGIEVSIENEVIEDNSDFITRYTLSDLNVRLNFAQHDMMVIEKYIKDMGDKTMENSRMVAEMKQLKKEVSQLEHENELLKAENENIKKIIHGERQLNFDSPLDFAKSLIEHRTHIEERAIENAKGAVLVLVPEHDRVTFDFDELEEIAEYLLTYCKHNKEDL